MISKRSLLILALVLPGLAEGQPPTEIIEVVGQTPLGAAVDIDNVAANVQQASADSIAAQGLIDLSAFMRRNLGSVFVNEAQGNPLQPDVQYRGFVGSPLLGLPQGLAVYQDGVRLNEPFGDTVNWALLADSAVESLVLMPGSNPLFGLNAIGGSIAIRSKDGFTDPGTSAHVFAGSFGRIGVQAETGESRNGFGYFVTGEHVDEEGWRDYSPTEATRAFGKLSWRADRSDVDLALNLASTDLIGNGAAPIELLARERDAIFTRPDQTQNELVLLSLNVDRELSSRFSLAGNLYLRSSDIDSLNGDDSDFAACEQDPGFICEEDDGQQRPVIDAKDEPIAADEALVGATINRTRTRQDGIGFGLQGTWSASLAGRAHSLVAGLSVDDAAVDFAASTELGSLDATRQAVPGGIFLGDAFTELEAETSNFGIFVADTLSLGQRLQLTLSGRYNRIEIALRDQLGTALDGDHEFERFNPAIGLVAALSDGFTFYAGYSESSRAPSPVELTCADEDDPCRLPNAFLADPPLEQVVARTFEAGLRGRGEAFEWHAGIFRTTSRDDILFISAGPLSNEGYFDNVGRTRREGVELNLRAELGRASLFINYSMLHASFRDSLRLPSPNNPAAFDGELVVRPGDELPLLPRHMLQSGVEYRLSDRLRLSASLNANSSFHLRGDEGNDIAEIGRSAVIGLRADYLLNPRLSLYLSIDNLFDGEYETFGVFGEADEVLGDGFEDSRFLSPGAPRAAWLGLRAEL